MADYWEKQDDYWEKKVRQADGSVAVKATGLRQFLTQTYTWMTLGLALTGLMAVLTVSVPFLRTLVFGNPFMFLILAVAEIGLVIAFSVSLRKGAAASKLLTMFLIYSALNGLTLSVIFLVYQLGAVAQAFFVAAAMFGGMSLYGLVSKRDLTGLGHFVRMGVWGLIIAMVINFFFASSTLDLMISLIGVGIFTVLAAVDTQKLKAYYAMHAGQEGSLKAVSLGGALTLYLDFINLFLFLLRLFGGNRR